MGQLAEQQTPAQQQAAVAERNAAGDALAAQHTSDAGARSDTSASQISRGLEFNPNNEPAAAAASSGAQPAGAVAAASGVASEYEGVVDYARSRGVDVSGFSDDNQLMDALLNRYARASEEDYYSQLGRQFLQQAPELQRQLQARPAAEAPAAPPPWEAPPFEERWSQMVERDPVSGVYLGKPGTPPEIVGAVNRFADYQRKFSANPIAAVRPFVEQTVPAMIEKAVNARIESYQREQTISQIQQRNAPWMYQTDASGRIQMGVGGRPVHSPQGARYLQHVNFLERNGMRDPGAVDQLAQQLTYGELATAQQTQHRAGQPAQAQQQAALASGRHQANVLQSLSHDARQITPGATEPDRTGMSLSEQMRASLGDFTDADFSDIDLMR